MLKKDPAAELKLEENFAPCRDNSEKCGRHGIAMIAFLAGLDGGEISHIAMLPLHASTASIVVAVAVAAYIGSKTKMIITAREGAEGNLENNQPVTAKIAVAVPQNI